MKPIRVAVVAGFLIVAGSLPVLAEICTDFARSVVCSEIKAVVEKGDLKSQKSAIEPAEGAVLEGVAVETVNADYGVVLIGDTYYIIDPGTLEVLKIVGHNCAPYPICYFE